MTKGEYWILDVVLEWRDAIVALEPNDIEMLQLAFNRKWHGLPHDQLLDTLDCLFQRGDLIASKSSALFQEASTVYYTPSRKEIEEQLQEVSDKLVYYGLTAQGGAAWEAASHPDWNLYLNRHGVSDEFGHEYQEMESCNKPLIEKYLEREIDAGRTCAETIEWEELTPWNAVYWKTFPHGYCVRYRTPDGIGVGSHEGPVWYTNYFDEPVV